MLATISWKLYRMKITVPSQFSPPLKFKIMIEKYLYSDIIS